MLGSQFLANSHRRRRDEIDVLWFLPSLAFAHGGGLDSYGCHNDRKNGGYHCHRSQPAPSSSPAIHTAPKPVVIVEVERPSAAETYAVVTASTLFVRARQSSTGAIQSRLRMGARVLVLDARGKWWKIDPDGSGPQRPGYVAARYLATSSSTVASTQPKRSRDEIRREIIRESIAQYPGSCACPYSTDRGGRRCGARSAYSKPGGRAPMCYSSDVPDALVRSRR